MIPGHCFRILSLIIVHTLPGGKSSRSRMDIGLLVQPQKSFAFLIPNLFFVMFNYSFLETFATDSMKTGCSQDLSGQKQIFDILGFFYRSVVCDEINGAYFGWYV